MQGRDVERVDFIGFTLSLTRGTKTGFRTTGHEAWGKHWRCTVEGSAVLFHDGETGKVYEAPRNHCSIVWAKPVAEQVAKPGRKPKAPDQEPQAA